jgi:biofilm PGA synthesis N-glycosyltransferase PgaC
LWIILREQGRVFEELGLRMRRNTLGVLGYLLVYPFVMSPASVWGYAEELRRSREGG